MFIQASDISNSLPKSKTLRDMCVDCFNLIFVTFKPPASLLCAYCDCNPMRAFETFNITKEPISKTSRFWMFWYLSRIVIGWKLSKGWRTDPEAFHTCHFSTLFNFPCNSFWHQCTFFPQGALNIPINVSSIWTKILTRLFWVGWGAVLLRCRNPKIFLASKEGGRGWGGVQQAKNLVCKVGLPQIVLELL